LSAINHFIKKGVRQAEIDEYLGEELSRAGYGGVEIAKTPLGERITIHAARPGIVIGRRGKNIRSITDELITRFGFENPQIEVKEVINPELNAKVMAYSLVSAIERGVHRRRAAYSVLRRVVNSGAKGCEILINGKLTSKRSRHEAYRMGLVAKSGELGTEYVQRANATAVMKLGSIGVTVNIMRGDLPLPDEITIKNIRLEEDEVTSEITEIIEEIPEKPVKIQEEVPKEKTPKKETVEEPKKVKEVTKKKTDLDKEVEELSDLIEKTPGEEAKPKTTKKKETPEKKPTTPTKKPSVTDDKKTKKEDVKVKPPVKKSEEKAKAPAKKVDEKSKAKTSTKKEEVKAKTPTKKVEEKPKASKKDEKESKTKTKKEGKK